jgi:DNA-directed RNA polymerase omega subunit
MSRVVEAINNAEANGESPMMDSKYRLIIVAAQRSKQLQRGARPRVDLDPLKHKPTRIALEEVERGKIGFSIIEADKS